MTQHLAIIALVVDDYDRAIAYYTGTLGFDLVEDSPRGPGKRWVVVSPPGDGGAQILLAWAANDEQASRIGNQTGGRVFLFLHTDDFQRDYAAYVANGVDFTEAPRDEDYAMVVVFRDLYGKHSFHTPLRYPGGKGKLARYVASVMEENGLCGGTYVEPYAGGAAVAMSLLLSGHAKRIHINDLSPEIHAFWRVCKSN